MLCTLEIVEYPGRQKCLHDPGWKWKGNLGSSEAVREIEEAVAASDGRDCNELRSSVSWRHEGGTEDTEEITEAPKLWGKGRQGGRKGGRKIIQRYVGVGR